VETLDEVRKIVENVGGPVSIAAGMPYNIRNFSIDDLRRCGVARVSLPTTLIFSSLGAIQKSLHLIKMGKLYRLADDDSLYSADELRELLDN
jgi:2-methylisocitrate lyase-like PEP mutase family enzyme